MIEEVILTVDWPNARAELTIRWRNCAVTTTSVAVAAPHSTEIRTDDGTLDLLRGYLNPAFMITGAPFDPMPRGPDWTPITLQRGP